jgi:hypothetical protein
LSFCSLEPKRERNLFLRFPIGSFSLSAMYIFLYFELDFPLKKACPSEKGGLRSCNPARGLLSRAARHSLVG